MQLTMIQKKNKNMKMFVKENSIVVRYMCLKAMVKVIIIVTEGRKKSSCLCSLNEKPPLKVPPPLSD